MTTTCDRCGGDCWSTGTCTWCGEWPCGCTAGHADAIEDTPSRRDFLRRWILPPLLVTALAAGCAPVAGTSPPGNITKRTTTQVNGVRTNLVYVLAADGKVRAIRVDYAIYKACPKGARWPDCKAAAK
jgi:hypothetical protein